MNAMTDPLPSDPDWTPEKLLGTVENHRPGSHTMLEDTDLAEILRRLAATTYKRGRN